MTMEFLLTYLIYCLALVGVVALFLYFRTKREKNELEARFKLLKAKAEVLQYFVEKGYETDNIDLNNFLN